MTAKPETVLSRAIQDALLAIGCIVVRVQSGCVRVKRGVMHLAPKGTPDMYVAHRGAHGWLEVKCEKGKRTPEQIAWAQKAAQQGVPVVEVRSVAEALDAVRGWGDPIVEAVWLP